MAFGSNVNIKNILLESFLAPLYFPLYAMNRRPHLLFITPRFPSPPTRGDQLRSFHFICELARDVDISLICFSRGECDNINDLTLELRNVCRDIIEVPLKRIDILSGMFHSLWSGLPFQCGYYRSRNFRKALREVVGSSEFDGVYCQLIRMAPYLPEIDLKIPIVIDFIDSLSLNMEQKASMASPPYSWIWSLESRRCKKYEKKLSGGGAAISVVSPVDREYIGSDRIVVIPNGVSTKCFYRKTTSRQKGQILFFGNMGYFANREAALFLVQKVIPKLDKDSFHVRIVGARPTPEMLALQSERIKVTGFVEDMASEMECAEMAVFPILSSSGMQNKVVEAMAAGVPVITTARVLGAIPAKSGVEVLVADNADAFAMAINGLHADPDRARSIALAGKKFVEKQFCWRREAVRMASFFNICGLY